MNIGIIGAGNIGGTLTRRFVALGHHVAVANSRDPERNWPPKPVPPPPGRTKPLTGRTSWWSPSPKRTCRICRTTS
jgi:hypothetical protein